MILKVICAIGGLLLSSQLIASGHVVGAKYAGIFDVMSRSEVCGYSFRTAERQCGFGPGFRYEIPESDYKFKHRVCVFEPATQTHNFSYWGCRNLISRGIDYPLSLNIYVQSSDFKPPWPGAEVIEQGDHYIDHTGRGSGSTPP